MALAWLWARLLPVVAVVAVAVCVAGVAFGSIDLHSVGQAWHLATSTFTWCGRRVALALACLVVRLVLVVTAAVCVAGLAFGSIDLHFVWQVW